MPEETLKTGVSDEFLRGFQPKDDSGEEFEILKGLYKTAVTRLTYDETGKFGARYLLDLVINEVLDGNGVNGRFFWKKYPDTEAGLGRLLNDLFKAGIEIPRTSVDEFRANLGRALDKDVYVRAFSFAPSKDFDGNDIPEGERKSQQASRIIPQKSALKKVKGATSGTKTNKRVPF